MIILIHGRVFSKGRIDEREIIRSLMQLTYDGILDYELDRLDPGRRDVYVHDLYKHLAIQRGAASGKILVDQKYFRENDIKCAEVETFVFDGHDDVLRRGPLPNLQFLVAHNVDSAWRLQLMNMPELRILKVFRHLNSEWTNSHLNSEWTNRHPNSELTGWRNTPHLTWLELEMLTCEDISELTNLRVLKLDDCTVMSCRRLCLTRMVDLQVLEISQVDHIEEIMGLGGLIKLKIMRLSYMPHLRKVGIYGQHLTQLQVLEIEDCELLKDVEGLSLLPNLKALSCLQDWLCEEVLMFTKSLQFLHLRCKGAEPLNLRDMSTLEILRLSYEPVVDGDIFWKGEEVKEIASKCQLLSLETILFLNCKEVNWPSFHGLINLRHITFS